MVSDPYTIYNDAHIVMACLHTCLCTCLYTFLYTCLLHRYTSTPSPTVLGVVVVVPPWTPIADATRTPSTLPLRVTLIPSTPPLPLKGKIWGATYLPTL